MLFDKGIVAGVTVVVGTADPEVGETTGGFLGGLFFFCGVLEALEDDDDLLALTEEFVDDDKPLGELADIELAGVLLCTVDEDFGEAGEWD